MDKLVRHAWHQNLYIININSDTIDTQEEAAIANTFNTNTANCKVSRCVQHFTHMMQETGIPEKCYTITNSISKSNNKDKPIVADNKYNITYYFLPGFN